MPDKTKILLIEEDPRITASIAEILSSYEIFQTQKSNDFLQKISELKPDLLLIDFDLQEKDGLLVYKDIKKLFPNCKAIMFSFSNSIPLAVTATKLGVFDFLRKPLEPFALKEAVSRALAGEGAISLDFSNIPGVEWLLGGSQEIKKLLKALKPLATDSEGLLVWGERGIDKRPIAEILHRNGNNSDKRFMEINLASFEKEQSESHFFLTLKELLDEPKWDHAIQKKRLPGTVFITGIEQVSESFKGSLIQFIKSKKSSVRVIVEALSKNIVEQIQYLALPPLRERKEDLPIIFSAYLKKLAPRIKFISPDVLEFLSYYEFPGNYDELKNIIAASALSDPAPDALTLKNLSIDAQNIKELVKSIIVSGENYNLAHARALSEKIWLKIVMEKSNWDVHSAARFLDMPKASLSDRLKTLELI